MSSAEPSNRSGVGSAPGGKSEASKTSPAPRRFVTESNGFRKEQSKRGEESTPDLHALRPVGRYQARPG